MKNTTDWRVDAESRIHHARGGIGLSLFKTRVEVEVETRSFDQIEDIKNRLTAAGYDIKVRR